MYVAVSAQQDWDEYAERLVFALKFSFDRIRGDTPFYLAYGWDTRSTIESVIPVGCTRGRDHEARRWRMELQRHYQHAREQVNKRLRRAIQERFDRNNDQTDSRNIEPGSRVWHYLDRVKEGYARKLAHMWLGPFRVSELIGDHATRLITAGTDYGVFPIVHLSKLKLVQEYPNRQKIRLSREDQPRFDFDEALLPEDSWERVLDQNEFEVEKILDTRSGKRTRFGRTHRDFLVPWKVYDDPAWVHERDLNCGALLREFERDRMRRNRFGVMQTHEEGNQ